MASLATRCTACGTVFRVVPDQLRVAGGLVRCGRCSEVFNAAEALVELEAPVAAVAPVRAAPTLPPPPPPPSLPPPPPPPPAPEPAPEPEPESIEPLPQEAVEDPQPMPAPALDLGTAPDVQPWVEPQPEPGTVFDLRMLPEPEPVPEVEPGPRALAEPEGESGREPADEEPAAPVVPAAADAAAIFDVPPPQDPLRSEPQLGADPLPDLLPGTAAAAAAPEAAVTEPRVEPDDLPSFVRSAERAERWRSPRTRGGLVALAVVGALALVLQAVFAYRDLIVAHFPGARDLLEPMCTQVLGCRIEPLRAIESLAVESSGLVRVEKSSVYKLQVALRNQAATSVAVPALELTLSNSLGKPIARRVLRASELGVNQATLAAGRELALQATLQAATEPVAGYTIELFYP